TSLELLVQPFDGVGCSSTLPLTWGQPGEGEEPITTFLQAVSNGTMLQPPFTDEGPAPRLDLFGRGCVDHVVVVGSDLVMEALGRMRQQVPVLVHGTALHWHAIPHDGDCGLKPRRAVDNKEFGPAQPTPDE